MFVHKIKSDRQIMSLAQKRLEAPFPHQQVAGRARRDQRNVIRTRARNIPIRPGVLGRGAGVHQRRGIFAGRFFCDLYVRVA